MQSSLHLESHLQVRQVLMALFTVTLLPTSVMAQEEPPDSPYVWPQKIVYKRQTSTGLKQFCRLTNYGKQKLGLVDAAGKVVLPANYDRVTQSGDGLFLVVNNADAAEIPKCWFFNVATNKLSTKSFSIDEELFQASEGLIGFRKHDEPDFRGIHKIGFYNYNHDLVIPERYQEVSEFRDGLAMVSPEIRGTDNPFRWQFIDKKGHVAAPEIFPVSLFYNGLAIASPYADPKAPAKVGAHSSSSSESLSPRPQRKYGLVDRQFKFVVKPIYTHLQLVAKDIYAAQSNETYHYIAIAPSGEKLFNFPNGVTKFNRYDENAVDMIVAELAANKDQVDGVIPAVCAVFDLSGKIIVPAKYHVFIDNGRIELSDRTSYGDSGSGVMNLNGEWIKPMVYPSRHFNSGMWNGGFFDEKARQFAWFLRDYDLIGMDRSTVQKLLGNGYESGAYISYQYYEAIGCGRPRPGFVLEFVANKVKRWRLSHGGQEERWYSENMIFRPNEVPGTNLVPKAMYKDL